MSLQDGPTHPEVQGVAAAPDLRRDMLGLLPDLRAFARFLVRDRAAADDLVQDTVVRALSALGQFQPGTNLKAWLFTILRNQFYEQARRRQREARALGAGLAPVETERAAQEDGAGLRDLGRLLWSLPPVLRESLVLVGAQELTHEEAARVCRARAHLARIIAASEAGQA